MKNIVSFIFFILMLQFPAAVFATDYYSLKSGGNAADLTTWNSSRSGNGTAPLNFNDPNDNFIVQTGCNITGTDFSCKGSLIIEAGGFFNTGITGNTRISTVVSINEGAVLTLSPNTSLTTGFIMIQGIIKNAGGVLRFSSSPVSTR
jgi:hypothetical protein